MVIFTRRMTEEEVKKYSWSNHPDIEWYWVQIDGYDLEHNIHIYVNKEDTPDSWQIITSETCIPKFAKIVLDLNFEFPSSKKLDKDLKEIKDIATNLDQVELVKQPWWLVARKREPPFMLANADHRAIAAYIHYFIWNLGKKFVPIENAICAVSEINIDDFARIPSVPTKKKSKWQHFSEGLKRLKFW